jgi:hypothetical protein
LGFAGSALTYKIMKFNIYGRFQIDARRENDAWRVYRIDQGKRSIMHDIVIPADLQADELLIYLDDIFHEFAGFGQLISSME